MAKRNSNNARPTDLRSLIATIVSVIVIAIAALIGAISGGLIDTDQQATPIPTLSPTQVAVVPGEVSAIPVAQGFGAQKDFWQVYFTAPTGSRDVATYVGGVDAQLVTAINGVQQTLDIAAFEWNLPSLTQAVINAHQRGVRVRMVVDREHTLEDENSTINQVIAAGIPVVDDARTGFMHNKFMIMDGLTVWMGSMNYTYNDVYRNNNNKLVLRSRRAAEAYQAKFNEMFEQRIFGSSRSANYAISYNQDGIPIQIMFSPEDDVTVALLNVINGAQSSIYFMAFSFTLDEVGDALLAKAAQGVDVQGIYEQRGSRTQFSTLPPLFCAGLPIREDGNPFTFHHKVFIIDQTVVFTGSFNISANAVNRNDENVVIIRDPALAAQYVAEFQRVQSQAVPPPADAITCP